MNLFFRASLILVLASAWGFAASQAGEARFTAQTMCYVSISGENRIAAYKLSPESGTLEHVFDLAVDGAPGALAVSPDRRFLYAALRSTKSIAAYRIDPATGALQSLGSVEAIDNPVYLAVDQSGRVLLTAYYGAAKAALYSIDAEGRVSPQPVQVIATETNPHSILVDRTNQFVFVPNTGSDTILQFRFEPAAARVTPNDPARVQTQTGAGPRHIAFHPERQVVYFVNEKNSSVTVYGYDGLRGTLEPLQSLPTLPAGFADNNTCADIHVTPDGKYLYASNRGHDSLAGFAIDPDDGRLISLGQTPTEKTPREFEIDPSGRFLYAAGQGSGRLACYRIDSATGRLDRFETYDVGASPAWVLCVPLPTNP